MSWTWWMTVLVILAVLVLIGCIPVGVDAAYGEGGVLLSAKIGFFRLQILPAKPKKPKKPKKKHTPEEIIDGFIDAVHRYGPGAKQILRNIRVHRLEGYWQIAAEDAAACAIRYGRICALLNTAFGFLQNLVKIEKTKLRVYPDFTAEKEEIRVLADIEANPLIILIGGIRIAFALLKDMTAKQKKETSKRSVHK